MKILYYIPEEYNSNDTPYKLISGIDKQKIDYQISNNDIKYLYDKIKFRKPDLIHIFGCSRRVIRTEANLYRFSNVDIIIHILNRDDVEAFNKIGKGVKRRLRAVIFSDLDLEQYIKKDKNIPLYSILPGTNIEHYYPQVLKQLSMKKEIVSYCDFSPDTKLHVLIEAMRYLPAQYFLTIIGNNLDYGYFGQLQELAVNLSIKSKLEFITDFFEQDVKEKLTEANLYITVCDNSNSISNAYRSLLYGTPVICPYKEYDIDGLAAIDSYAPKVIAKQIKEICESDDLVDVNEAKKHLSWSAKVKELEDIYENLKFSSKAAK